MYAAARAMADVPMGEWPCIECWGEGCRHCHGKGTAPRVDFATWYYQRLENYYAAMEEYQYQLDRAMQGSVKPDFYDLDRLRKISPNRTSP